MAQTAIVTLMLTQTKPLFGTQTHAAETAVEVLWAVGLVNAVNLLDHLDGLAAGVVMIEALAAAAILALHGAMTMAGLGVATAAAAAGFFVYNFNPASIFMGDAGALTLGLLLAILTLEIGRFPVSSPIGHVVTPLLVAFVPLMDTAIVTMTRLATGHRISRGGQDHSSHRLVRLGLNDRRAAMLLYALAAIAGGFAVQLTMWPDAIMNMAVPFLLLGFALVGMFLMNLTFDGQPPGRVYHQVHRLARAILTLAYKRRAVEVALDALVITCAYYGALLIKLDFAVSRAQASALNRELPWVLMVSYAGLLSARTYRGIWQFAALADGWRLMRASGAVALILLLSARLLPLGMDLSTGLLFVVLLFNLLLGSRLSFRILARLVQVFAVSRRKILIVGAGAEGEAAARYFLRTPIGETCQMLGFLDDDEFKRGKLIHGYPVLGSLNDLGLVYRKRGFEELLVAERSLSPEDLQQVIGFAERAALMVRRFSMGIGQVEPAAPASKPVPIVK